MTPDSKVKCWGPFAKDRTEAEVEALMARGHPGELPYVPIVVGMKADSVDREWAEAIRLRLAKHAHFNVRGNAVLVCGKLVLQQRHLTLCSPPSAR